MNKKNTGQKRALMWLGLAAVVCGVGGFALWYWAGVMDARHARYAEAVQTFTQSVSDYRAGNAKDAEALAKRLSDLLAAHKGEVKWEALRPYQQVAEGLAAYGMAEKMLDRHRSVSLERPQEGLPDPKEILQAYAKFEQNFRAAMGKEPFASPDLLWRMENDIATSQAWQMAVKLALQDANPDAVMPLLEAAVQGFRRAHIAAEKARLLPGDAVTNPVRFVSQNEDFMSRLTAEQQTQKEKQPQRGYGSMLQRGNQPAEKLLPMPMPSIGNSRIEGGKK